MSVAVPKLLLVKNDVRNKSETQFKTRSRPLTFTRAVTHFSFVVEFSCTNEFYSIPSCKSTIRRAKKYRRSTIKYARMSGRFCSKNNTSLLFEQNRPNTQWEHFIQKGGHKYFWWFFQLFWSKLYFLGSKKTPHRKFR